MKELIITDNQEEELHIRFADERYALIYNAKGMYPEWRGPQVVILNPREARAIADFILSQPTTFKFRNETQKEVMNDFNKCLRACRVCGEK